MKTQHTAPKTPPDHVIRTAVKLASVAQVMNDPHSEDTTTS